MTDSSAEPGGVLGKIRTKHVVELLSLLSRLDNRSNRAIERAYLQSCVDFAETLTFLINIGWVEEDASGLNLTANGRNVLQQQADEQRLRVAILRAVTSPGSPYRVPLGGYIRKFQVLDSLIIYRPSFLTRSQDRPFRDFLMDLRALEYRGADDLYVLSTDFADLYITAVNLSRRFTPSQAQQALRRREELGYAAEVAVLDYERARVGEPFASRVEHISAQSPFACYDIRSLTLADGEASDRYIEVKAVPRDSLQFYWTRGEIDAAIALRKRYFLYLLPHSVQGGFDMDALRIFCDPAETVLQDHTAWDVEHNVVVCRYRH